MMPLRRLRSQLQTRKGRGRGAGLERSSCWVMEALAETYLGVGGKWEGGEGQGASQSHPQPWAFTQSVEWCQSRGRQ